MSAEIKIIAAPRHPGGRPATGGYHQLVRVEFANRAEYDAAMTALTSRERGKVLASAAARRLLRGRKPKG